MIRLLTDEHVPKAAVRGLRARAPAVDLVRNQDVGLLGAGDPEPLAFATAEGRVLVSRDRETLIGLAYDRLATGDHFPGLVMYRADTSVGKLVDDLATILGVYTAADMVDRVEYVPL